MEHPSYRSHPPSAFIVGMSRAGTTWMMQSLNAHPELAVFGETGFWGKHHITSSGQDYDPEESSAMLKRMPGVRGMDLTDHRPEQIVRVLSSDGLRKLFDPLRQWIVDQKLRLSPRDLFDKVCGVVADYSGKQHVIEKTPHHVLWTKRILEYYPKAKFIVMCRDPYDFMLSYKHQGDRKEKGAKQSFRQMYHPIGCAMVYRGYARAIQRLRKQHEDQMILVSLESIRQSPEQTLKEVQEFLNVPVIADLRNQAVNSSFPSGPKPELNSEDIFWMSTLAGNFARELGYPPPHRLPGWGAGIKSVSRLPIWAFGVFRHLSSYQNANVFKYLIKWIKG